MFVLLLRMFLFKSLLWLRVLGGVGCCFLESKSLVGLDECEVQSCLGWYKYITFACLVHALLAVLSCCFLGVKNIAQYGSSFCGGLVVFKKSAVCMFK